MKKMVDNFIFRLKEKALNKRSVLNDRRVCYLEWKDIRSCVVMADASDEAFKTVAMLEGKLKGVALERLYLVGDRKDCIETDDAVWLKNGDLGFGGRIRNNKLGDLLLREHDLLVDLTRQSTALSRYVLSACHASCIVGMKKDDSVADVVIASAKDGDELVDKMMNIFGCIKRY